MYYYLKDTDIIEYGCEFIAFNLPSYIRCASTIGMTVGEAFGGIPNLKIRRLIKVTKKGNMF